jgi:alkylation response protein AidB-like acyl-CoA dehydrogenase
MAENLFLDVPDRSLLLRQFSRLRDYVMDWETTLGDKDTFSNAEEGLEFYQGALEEIGKFAAQEVRPKAASLDREGVAFSNGEVVLPPTLEGHLKRFVELGVFSAQVSRQYGGMNLPQAVQILCLETLAQACPNTSLTVAAFSMASFISKWGTEEQKARILPKLMTNTWQTAMALTEPDAGSDLGKLRTTGIRKGDHFIVNGTKRFITNGNADLVFTLVRTNPSSQGLQGLSVLIIPKTAEGRANLKVTKIEDKVCLHSSPTCELSFEDSVGELLGPEGDGFKVMLDLMNEARLAMAALATGIATAAFEEAKAYAKQRVTWDKPIIQHPLVADMLYEMELETKAMRSMVMEAACCADLLTLAEKKGDKAAIKKWKKRYRRLTPLCKYYCCEKAVTIAKNALQLFGGYGVCREYPVERLWRESVIYPIYEGTSQIQSLMVLKDTLKDVAQHAAGFLGSLAGAWAEAKVTLDPVKSSLLHARNELNQAIRRILLSIIKDKFKADIEDLKQSKIQEFIKEFSLNLLTEKTDLTYPFLSSERLTRITCDYYALKCLADNSGKDQNRRDFILDFAELALPRMKMENTYMADRISSTLKFMAQNSCAIDKS